MLRSKAQTISSLEVLFYCQGHQENVNKEQAVNADLAVTWFPP